MRGNALKIVSTSDTALLLSLPLISYADYFTVFLVSIYYFDSSNQYIVCSKYFL